MAETLRKYAEETYKGNYHLYADIDGKEHKFVIGMNKDEFSLIRNIGLTNLTADTLKSIVEKYFKL